MKDKKLDRRSFLKNSINLGLATGMSSSIGQVLALLSQSTINNAYAQDAGLDNFYFGIHLAGGPSRWHFDQVLAPNPGDKEKLIFNPMMVTKRGSKEVGFEASYETFEVGGVHLPHLWSMDVPNSSGGHSPLSELAKNAIFIRGLDGSGSHPVGGFSQLNPIPGSPSTHYLATINSVTAPISAIGMGYYASQYISANGTSLTTINSIDNMVQPFTLGNNSRLKKRNLYSIADAVTNEIAKVHHSSGEVSRTVVEERRKTLKIMEKGVDGLRDRYNAIFAKYTTIMKQALTEFNMPGIDDAPLISDGTRAFNTGVNGVADDQVRVGVDLTNLISESSEVQELVKTMALAELALVERLSTSVTGYIGALIGLNPIQRQNLSGEATGTHTAIMNDSHYEGSAIQLYFCSKYYKALAACLLEFSNTLKKIPYGRGTMWDRTVVHIMGDFNRVPNKGAQGADHGGTGTCVSLYSGQIKGPIVQGDTLLNGKYGSWGETCIMESLGNRNATTRNVSSTVAALFDVPSPFPNDDSFLARRSGILVPKTRRANNV